MYGISLEKEGKKMLALEEYARLSIKNARQELEKGKINYKQELEFWKRLQNEINIIAEGLADDELQYLDN